jgi:dTDP-glucose 4,6-dehydratase
VTGGLGFIGSSFVRNILGEKIDELHASAITILDSYTYAADIRRLEELQLDQRVNIVRASVIEKKVLAELVSISDAIVHFAAESHVDRSINNGQEFIETNVLGSFNVFEECVRAKKRIVHVSTDEVYGSINKGKANESSTLNPSSPYSASKAASDLIALSMFKTYGLDVSITRASNNYGKYQHAEKLIPLFMNNLSKGLNVPMYGDGRNVRDWLHIDDHCSAIAKVLTQGRAGEIYNISGREHYSNIQITKMLLEFYGLDNSYISWVSDRLGHDFRYAINDQKIAKELSWKPTRKLNDTLSEIHSGLHIG